MARDENTGWHRLVTVYAPVVYVWCRRAGVQSSDASDVVQEVMRSVARNIKGFHHDRRVGTFRGWLRRITQRRIIDFRRRQNHRIAPRAVGGSTFQMCLQQLEDPYGSKSSSEPSGGGVSAEKQQVLAKVQAEFSTRNWQIFWLVVVEERATADVAEQFGVTPNVVRLAKSRILKRLREIMTPSGPADDD